MLQHERARREEEFRRQQEALVQSISAAEKKRLDLERDKQEKERELNRLAELEELAQIEAKRLADVRKSEAEREIARAKDLEARKEQLAQERNLQRQLEMQKLENERKRMLLEQQRAEYESEHARHDREKREQQERVKRQELQIREREVELERQQIEAERSRKELENEKIVLAQQREIEYERLHRDRVVEIHRPVSDTPQHLPTPAPPLPPPQRSTPSNTPRSSSVAEKERELERLRREREAYEEAHRETELDQRIAAERNALLAAQQRAVRSSPISTAAVPLTSPAPPGSQMTLGPGPLDLRHAAVENLALLASDLGVPALHLDDNNTCVVSVEDKYTLLITFDPATERLYLYSTLSTFVPKLPESKLKLYEFLLEGSLLGRDMCGGGVGISLKNDFVLMSTSIYLPTSPSSALKSITPLFVESLTKWRARVKELIGDETTDTTSDATASSLMAAVQGQAQGPDYPMVGLEVTDGVTIDGVHSKYSDGVVVVSCKGPAARAGLLPNDYVRSVNGRRISSLKDFQDIVRSLRPSTTVPFAIDRAGSSLILNVLVGSTKVRPGDAKYKNIVRLDGTPSRQPSPSGRIY